MLERPSARPDPAPKTLQPRVTRIASVRVPPAANDNGPRPIRLTGIATAIALAAVVAVIAATTFSF